MPGQFDDVSSIYKFNYPFITITNGYKKSETEEETCASRIYMNRTDSRILLEFDCKESRFESKVGQKFTYRSDNSITYAEGVRDWSVVNICYKDEEYFTSTSKTIDFKPNGTLSRYETDNDGAKEIITYDNDQPPDWTAIIIAGSISSLLGTGFLFVYRAAIVHNRKQQQKRDARIIKKYGKLKK
jgi:hypothetical protein